MSLWTTVRNWFDSNREQLTREFLPADGGAVTPHQDYFRLWLADVFTAKDRRWGIDRHPAVHATVRLGYAGRTLDMTSVVSPPPAMRGPGPRHNHPLTALLPYSGGVVEIEAGLTEIDGHNAVGAAIGALQDMSSLIAAPIGQALAVADKVSAGVQRLLDSGDGNILLALHDGFAAPSEGSDLGLRSGHLVCIAAAQGTFARDDLSVQAGRLHHRGAPLTGHDYVVFWVERATERDDWRFADLESLVDRAKDAYLSGDEAAAGAFRSAVLAYVLKSPDLMRADRTRLALALKEELDEAAALGHGATGEARLTVEGIVATRAISADEARRTPPPTLEDLLA